MSSESGPWGELREACAKLIEGTRGSDPERVATWGMNSDLVVNVKSALALVRSLPPPPSAAPVAPPSEGEVESLALWLHKQTWAAGDWDESTDADVYLTPAGQEDYRRMARALIARYGAPPAPAGVGIPTYEEVMQESREGFLDENVLAVLEAADKVVQYAKAGKRDHDDRADWHNNNAPGVGQTVDYESHQELPKGIEWLAHAVKGCREAIALARPLTPAPAGKERPA